MMKERLGWIVRMQKWRRQSERVQRRDNSFKLCTETQKQPCGNWDSALNQTRQYCGLDALSFSDKRGRLNWRPSLIPCKSLPNVALLLPRRHPLEQRFRLAPKSPRASSARRVRWLVELRDRTA